MVLDSATKNELYTHTPRVTQDLPCTLPFVTGTKKSQRVQSQHRRNKGPSLFFPCRDIHHLPGQSTRLRILLPLARLQTPVQSHSG